jgi:hypothetical protein
MTIDLESSFCLSIDKISLTCNDTNHGQVEETCHRLLESANGPLSRMQIKSSRWHRLQCTLPIPNSTSSFLIQAGSRLPNISDYRFECNPSIIGPEGLRYASDFLDSITGIGTNALFANGKITRIDLALDLPGLSLDNVIVRSKGQRKHGVYTSARSKIETIYLGSVKANRTAVYTKIKGDYELLRVERRMKPNILGKELSGLSNPFDKVQMIATDSLLPYLEGMVPEQFFDSIRMRGIRNAIAGLTPRQRREIKAVLSNPEESLLPSMPLIWNCWPHVLKQSGLGTLCDPQRNREAAE